MQHRGDTLSAIESSEVRTLIERIGERRARDYLGISAQTIARAVAAMHLQRATVALIRARLREWRSTAA